MSFKTRNLFYLRISEHSVLPVYMYLDERHLEWMSDRVLQHVLSDLRPRILPKLLAEAGAFGTSATGKKTVVDTHRGDTYQFCYFLRRTEPHSVVIKTRNFIAKFQEQTRPQATMVPTATHGRYKKRKQRTSTSNGSPPSRLVKKRRKTKMIELDSEASGGGLSNSAENYGAGAEETIVVEDSESEGIIDVDEASMSPQDDTFDLPVDVDEDEEKPKPRLQLNYKGFSIYGQCLCIVVEPWPAVRSTNRTLQELGGISGQRSTHGQSTQEVSNLISRGKTPLFLAEDNDMDQDEVETRESNPVTHAWDDLERMDESDTDSEMGAMMAFSQALNLAGDNRPGAAEDEDEIEGAVLFGDADEARQL